MAECCITSLDCDESTFLPKIVNFQNGQLNPKKASKLQCSALLDPTTNKTVIAVATEKMAYVGSEDPNSDLCYTLLAIRNKKANKIRLVTVNTVSLNVQMSKINSLLDVTLNSSKNDVRELNKTFGSKKQKQRTEQIERMKLNVSNVEDELKKAVSDITIKDEDLVAPVVDENDRSYRPPMNRNAATVDQVYDLKTIINKSELAALKDLATEVLENSFEENKFVPFVTQYIQELKKSSSPNLKSCQLLLYIDAILKFFKLPVKSIGLKKGISLAPHPRSIVSKVLEEFTTHVGNSRHRPMSMRDKSTCYVLVLSLLALDYKVDLEPLAKSAGIGIKKLADVARILGAQYNTSTNTIVLKLPLPPPPSPNKRKRNKN